MALKRTELHPVHEDLGAKFTEFSGYEMPVQFSSIIEEHEAVREDAGLFDVSHMGNLWIEEGEAVEALSAALTCDASEIEEGGSKYAAILREDGTIVDDLFVFHTAHGWHVVPNAGVDDEVAGLVEDRGPADVEVATDETAILALQGPNAVDVLERCLGEAYEDLSVFHNRPHDDLGDRAFVSRTGYTGEDGFELVFPQRKGPEAFRALLEAGESRGLLPAGLGARDTLRLEAGFNLASHEFAGGRTPLEARMKRFVDWDHDFVGRDALEGQREADDHDRLVGIHLEERGVPRQGNPVLVDGEEVGEVTSGTMSPTLDQGVALAYVPPDHSKVDTEVAVSIRGEPTPARVASLPFV
jgi:aminomethyltransferase